MIGAIVALLGAGVVMVFSIGQTASTSELPNPNGYNDLLRAGQAVAGKIGDFPDLDHSGLRALVATNAEALRLVRVGLSHRSAVPTDVQITNFATISRDLMGLKSLGLLLCAEGRLAEMENHPADAARSYIDAIHLGIEMSRGGLMMNRLVGIACEGLGSIRLVKLLPQLTCEQIRPVIAELEKIDENTVPWREVLQNENRFARAQLGSYPNPIKLASDLWQARNVRKASEERHDVAAAHLRLLTAEVALRTYRCDQGTGPGTLAELIPRYLQHLPIDPFSGKPLVYRIASTNWLLYSLGPDRVDNAGIPVGKLMSGDYLILMGLGASKSGKGQDNGDLLYDSGW